MARLSKEDLAQMNRDYFQSLEKEKLVEVADNLHLYAVEQWEKNNSDSSNSSQPPSGDNPFQNQPKSAKSKSKSSFKEKQKKDSIPKRKAGKQEGAKGFGRTQILKIDEIVSHSPNKCSACNQTKLFKGATPYMGHHVLELETTEGGLKIVCQHSRVPLRLSATRGSLVSCITTIKPVAVVDINPYPSQERELLRL